MRFFPNLPIVSAMANASPRAVTRFNGSASFWAGDPLDLRPQLPRLDAVFEMFRADPAAHPLKTASGRIQLYSEKIASFGYDDCIGHAAWFDKTEWLGAATRYPLHLISSQPPAAS